MQLSNCSLCVRSHPPNANREFAFHLLKRSLGCARIPPVLERFQRADDTNAGRTSISTKPNRLPPRPFVRPSASSSLCPIVGLLQQLLLSATMAEHSSSNCDVSRSVRVSIRSSMLRLLADVSATIPCGSRLSLVGGEVGRRPTVFGSLFVCER